MEEKYKFHKYVNSVDKSAQTCYSVFENFKRKEEVNMLINVNGLTNLNFSGRLAPLSSVR